MLAPSRNPSRVLAFAYQFNPKTVFCVAAGITSIPGTQVSATMRSTIRFKAATGGGHNPGRPLAYQHSQHPFPQGLIAPTGSTPDFYRNRNEPTGALYNINRGYYNGTSPCSTSRQQNLLVEAAYVGNRGVHFYMASRALNALPDQISWDRLGQLVPNPFSGIVSPVALRCAHALRSQLLLPRPQYTAGNGRSSGGVVNPYAYTGDSIFHAFTLKIESFSRGFRSDRLFEIEADRRRRALGQVRPGAVTGGAPQD